jgi:hypothetical protein
MRYLEPYMTEALAEHVLREITLPGSLVRGFYLEPPGGSRVCSILILFTPEGTILKGDLRLGENGLLSHGRLPNSVHWFATRHSEAYVCSKFLPSVWQADVAVRDLREMLGDNPSLVGIQDALVRWEFADPTPDEVLGVLSDAGVDIDTRMSVGFDYPLHDAGWLVAVQQRFADLYNPLVDN